MDTLALPISRIILRYIAAALVTYGLATPEMAGLLAADAEVERLIVVVVGGLLGAITEAAYAVARKTGGPT